MCRRFISALLVLGWISLSVFDVVEDLDEVPGQIAVSSAPEEDSSATKRGGWGPLANNIVESANQTHPTEIAPVSFNWTIRPLDLDLDFRRHFRLHKLYRVFLI